MKGLVSSIGMDCFLALCWKRKSEENQRKHGDLCKKNFFSFFLRFSEVGYGLNLR